MVEVYFLKDKERTLSTDPVCKIEIDQIISAFGIINFKFLSKNNISLTREPPSDYESRVVLLIGDDEAEKLNSQRGGFYVLDNISSNQFAEKLLKNR